MPDLVKPVPFVSNATIYRPGAGHPFPPGSELQLHPDHAEDFRKAGLEYVAPKSTVAVPASVNQVGGDKTDSNKAA